VDILMRKKVIEIEKIVRPIKHARFYVQGGNYDPIGFMCGDIKIMRKRGESTEELRSRSRDSVEWPDLDTLNVFIPIRSTQP
jgi:hypothetical protein